MDGVKRHMARHASIVGPKFQSVLNRLESGLGGKGIAKPVHAARWVLCIVRRDAWNGEAYRRVSCEHGVRLTSAGAAHPCGHDPEDRHIRLAPTFPSQDELDDAMEVFVICAYLVSIRTQLRYNDPWTTEPKKLKRDTDASGSGGSILTISLQCVWVKFNEVRA
jgi:hypothetical protein